MPRRCFARNTRSSLLVFLFVSPLVGAQQLPAPMPTGNPISSGPILPCPDPCPSIVMPCPAPCRGSAHGCPACEGGGGTLAAGSSFCCFQSLGLRSSLSTGAATPGMPKVVLVPQLQYQQGQKPMVRGRSGRRTTCDDRRARLRYRHHSYRLPNHTDCHRDGIRFHRRHAARIGGIVAYRRRGCGPRGGFRRETHPAAHETSRQREAARSNPTPAPS